MTFAMIQPDVAEVQLSLALMLYDGFTGAQELIGNISVSLSYETLTSPLMSPLTSPPQFFQQTFKRPFRKTPQATFLFFGLFTGEYVAHVRSNVGLPDQTPQYYLPADVSITVADLPVTVPVQQPIWPAFPDINLADSTKPLDDPTQNAAYRTQRLAATLQPSTAYPFPAGSTLVRGTVFANGAPLAGATVQSTAAELQYLTGEDGEFVLFFTQISGVDQTITLQATHALHPAVQQNTDVHRGMTVATNIVMAT
jgi:hypothetical protein